ncbi:MAG: helix-turn-helix transcriptional regulator [Lautropia sp.]|nr:helix-turn-helix transcriptional regulator [Lautropia sp.]
MSFILSTHAEILKALGERLRLLRLMQSLTQQELAEMAGLSPGALRKLEHNGQSSLETVVRVAVALGLTDDLDTLFLPPRQTMRQVEAAAKARQRQRAPRRSSS